MNENERVYLLTDGCMWEINKKMGDEHPHAVEVVDIETGAVRYIRSGAKVRLIEGNISDIRTQKAYNEATESAEVPTDGQDMPKRKVGKNKGTKEF